MTDNEIEAVLMVLRSSTTGSVNDQSCYRKTLLSTLALMIEQNQTLINQNRELNEKLERLIR